MVLFGFSTLSEREMFVLLTGVKGVGPKTALGILSGMGADQLSDHIASGNAQALVSIPGIGKKSAERLVLELRDKIDRVAVVQSSAASGGDGSAKALVRGDALSALLELGYHRTAAERAIRAALKSHPDAESSVESMIKGALREMQR